MLRNERISTSFKRNVDPKYNNLLEVTITEHNEMIAEPNINCIFSNSVYKAFRHVTSKTLRLSVNSRNELISPKIAIDPDIMENVLKKIKKLTV